MFNYFEFFQLKDQFSSIEITKFRIRFNALRFHMGINIYHIFRFLVNNLFLKKYIKIIIIIRNDCIEYRKVRLK